MLVSLLEIALCVGSSAMVAPGMAKAQAGVFVGNDSEINCAVACVVNLAWKIPIVGAELSGFEQSFVEAE